MTRVYFRYISLVNTAFIHDLSTFILIAIDE